MPETSDWLYLFTLVLARHPSKSKAAILLESCRPSSCIKKHTQQNVKSIELRLPGIIM